VSNCLVRRRQEAQLLQRNRATLCIGVIIAHKIATSCQCLISCLDLEETSKDTKTWIQ